MSLALFKAFIATAPIPRIINSVRILTIILYWFSVNRTLRLNDILVKVIGQDAAWHGLNDEGIALSA